MTAPLLLIVEDEAAIRELVAFVCEAEGFRTARAGSVAEAKEAFRRERPDLVLLDRMLPDRSGLDWLKDLRSASETAGLPVIILTARGDAPANAAPAEDHEHVIVCGPLTMNETRFEAAADGVPLKLSAKEFKLLSLFASKPGRVFSRQNLLDAVWPSAFVDERTVDVHMLRLRKALAGTAAEDLIETVRGVGYRCRDV